MKIIIRFNKIRILFAGYEKAPVAPRFRKQGGNPAPAVNGGSPTSVSNDELSLRPPPNSMIKMFPQSVKPNNNMFGPMFPDHSKPSLPKLSPPKSVISPKEALLASAAKNTIEKMKAKKEKVILAVLIFLTAFLKNNLHHIDSFSGSNQRGCFEKN